jgi:hypothetical protein
VDRDLGRVDPAQLQPTARPVRVAHDHAEHLDVAAHPGDALGDTEVQ